MIDDENRDNEQDRYINGPAVLRDLVKRKEINHVEFFILLEIDSLCRHAKGCFIKDSTLAEKCAISRQTVKNNLVSLKKKGLIESKQIGRKRYLRCYWNQEFPRFSCKKVKKTSSSRVPLAVVRGYRKRYHHINTSLNHSPSENNLMKNNGRVGLSPTAESNNSTRDNEHSISSNGVCINELGNGQFHDDLQKKNTYQLGHYILAKRLHSALNKINYARHPKTKIATWAKQLSQMEKRSTPRPRLRAAINWYINRCMDGSVKDENNYIPQIYSIQSLDTKFDRIEAAMKRQQEKALPTKISKAAQRIVKDIRSRYFNLPKGLDEHLPGVIQKSMDNMDQFINAMLKVSTRYTKYLRSNLGLETIAFIPEWIEKEIDRVSRWSDWSGDPKTLIFSAQNKTFQRNILHSLGEYKGEPRTGRKFLDRVLETMNGS